MHDIRRRLRQRLGISNESEIEQRLRTETMTDELLTEGHREMGDIVQAYCDHPPELRHEYFDGQFIRKSCKCGCYLGIVEDS